MVELVNDKGIIRQESIDEAEKILRYKRVNPMQSWQIKGDKYIFDGETIKKKETPKKKESK